MWNSPNTIDNVEIAGMARSYNGSGIHLRQRGNRGHGPLLQRFGHTPVGARHARDSQQARLEQEPPITP